MQTGSMGQMACYKPPELPLKNAITVITEKAGSMPELYAGRYDQKR